jgi:hypothetical protein
VVEPSDHFLVVEKMVRQGEVARSELDHLLSSLEEQGRITSSEHLALLELAERLADRRASPG